MDVSKKLNTLVVMRQVAAVVVAVAAVVVLVVMVIDVKGKSEKVSLLRQNQG